MSERSGVSSPSFSSGRSTVVEGEGTDSPAVAEGHTIPAVAEGVVSPSSSKVVRWRDLVSVTWSALSAARWDSI